MRTNKIFFMALGIAIGFTVSAQSANQKIATPATKDRSANPNIEHMRIVNEKAAAEKAAAKPAVVPPTKAVTTGSGNGVKHTPRVIDPKESVYKKAVTTK